MDELFSERDGGSEKLLNARSITELDLENPETNMFEQFAIVKDEISILPKKLNKKIIKNLESEGCCDSNTNFVIKKHSEELMKKWVEEFTN